MHTDHMRGKGADLVGEVDGRLVRTIERFSGQLQPRLVPVGDGTIPAFEKAALRGVLRKMDARSYAPSARFLEQPARDGRMGRVQGVGGGRIHQFRARPNPDVLLYYAREFRNASLQGLELDAEHFVEDTAREAVLRQHGHRRQ